MKKTIFWRMNGRNFFIEVKTDEFTDSDNNVNGEFSFDNKDEGERMLKNQSQEDKIYMHKIAQNFEIALSIKNFTKIFRLIELYGFDMYIKFSPR